MKSSVRIAILAGVVIVIALLLQFLSPVLTPFLVAASLAYFLDPVVDKMEKKGIGRTLAVVLLFLLGAIFLVICLLILVPLLGSQITLLSAKIPLIVEWFQLTFLPMLEAKIGYSIDIDTEQLKQKLQQDWSQLGSILTRVLTEVSQSSLFFLALIGNLVLIPIVAFYILVDWDEIMAKVDGLLPRDIEPVVKDLALQVNEVLSSFVRGQLVVMLTLGAVYSAGLLLLGIDMALVLGMLAGLASIVPYMGFAVGIIASFIAAWFQFHDPMMLVWVLAVFSVGQALEGMILTPMLVGDKIGLHPVAVIFAVMAGGQLFGFVGMLVALPVAAVIMVLLRYLHASYLASNLYNPDDQERYMPEVAEAVATELAQSPADFNVDAGLVDTVLEIDDKVQ